MYVLQRNGDVFEMRHETSETVPGPVVSAPLLWAGGTTGAGRRAAWEAFIRTGEITDNSLPKPIADSWRRCRDMGVDPLMPRCAEFAPAGQVEPQAAVYAELAAQVERRAYEQVRRKGLLITVAEAHGRILRTCGSKEVLLQADNLHFGPGAVWSEQSVGTNAISLALSDGIPAQVLGEEHFCSSHQAWGCSAAPIYTPFGHLWGCFDISGPATADHSQALWIAVGAAREIERLLLNASLSSMENKSRALLNTLFSSMPVGVVMVDAEGTVTYANDLAERLLRPNGKVRGCPAEHFFDYAHYCGTQRRSACGESRPLLCRANPGLHAQAIPFITGAEESRYILITLQADAPARTAPPSRAIASLQKGNRPFGGILYRSAVMARVVEQARHMAEGPAAILLHGETGTGKELFARAIHAASARASGPFVAINCGALPRDLIQSELFGYERGAFTGAVEIGRPGKFEQANKGTLFLDEISEMPLEMQVNLLRPLEDRRVTRVGGKENIQVDFRLITATNRDLDQLMAAGTFREDLFYRIHVLALEIPPLRERREDIGLIAEQHCRRLCQDYGLPFGGLSAQALRLLEDYDWPGNVRQLVHSMEFAVNMAHGGCILPEHLPAHLRRGGGLTLQPAPPTHQGFPVLPPRRTPDDANAADFNLGNLEARAIRAALAHHKGNMLQTAKALGIGRNTLYAKLRRLGLDA